MRKVTLPGLGTASNLIGLEDDDEAYYAYSDFLMPQQVFKTSVKTGKSELWAKVEVPVDTKPYMVKQVFYPSKDGTQISMFIVARKDLKRDGNNTTLLYGYGGFDVSLRACSYMTAFFYVLALGNAFAVVPFFGLFVSVAVVLLDLVWSGLVLSVVARERHGLAGGRAAFAGWLPSALVALLLLVVVALSVAGPLLAGAPDSYR